MLLTIIKERNLAPITGNDKIKLSKPGLTLLQVVFERQLLIVISGSVAVAAAAKRAGPKKEDVSVADFIGQLNKRSKKDK
jgi:histone H3/H4